MGLKNNPYRLLWTSRSVAVPDEEQNFSIVELPAKSTQLAVLELFVAFAPVSQSSAVKEEAASWVVVLIRYDPSQMKLA